MEVHVNRLYNKPRNKTIGSPTPTGANYSDVHTHNSLSFCCFLFWPQTQLHYYYYYLPDESLSASTLFLFHSSDAMNKIQSPLTSGQVELDWLGLALFGFPPVNGILSDLRPRGAASPPSSQHVLAHSHSHRVQSSLSLSAITAHHFVNISSLPNFSPLALAYLLTHRPTLFLSSTKAVNRKSINWLDTAALKGRPHVFVCTRLYTCASSSRSTVRIHESAATTIDKSMTMVKYSLTQSLSVEEYSMHFCPHPPNR